MLFKVWRTENLTIDPRKLATAIYSSPMDAAISPRVSRVPYTQARSVEAIYRILLDDAETYTGKDECGGGCTEQNICAHS